MGLILGGFLFLTMISGIWMIMADLTLPDVRQLRFGLIMTVVPMVIALIFVAIGASAPEFPDATNMTLEQAYQILGR